MKKSKHYRKDVILARVIAALLLILLIAIISLAVSLLTKPSGSEKDTQNTQNTQDVNQGYDESENIDESENTEDVEATEDTENTEPEASVESESEEEEQIYVQTTTQVKLRKEPNTTCATLDRIDGGTKLLVLESLDGWYKVTYNGQTGYVSADYAKVVEE